MHTTPRILNLFVAAGAAFSTAVAHSGSAPPFDVAYRAWDTAMELSRHNRKPELAGQCGQTFRPVAVPALRKQTREEQDAAARACVDAARQACANPALQRTAGIGEKCREFR